MIGICDTPTELFEEVAHALGSAVRPLLLRLLRAQSSRLAARGLLRRRVRSCIGSGAIRSGCARCTSVPLFDPAVLAKLRLLPTEYVYYYDQPQRAFDNVRRAGQTRAQSIAAADTTRCSNACASRDADAVAVYEQYLRREAPATCRSSPAAAGPDRAGRRRPS